MTYDIATWILIFILVDCWRCFIKCRCIDILFRCDVWKNVLFMHAWLFN